jgi:hypothetical protein
VHHASFSLYPSAQLRSLEDGYYRFEIALRFEMFLDPAHALNVAGLEGWAVSQQNVERRAQGWVDEARFLMKRGALFVTFEATPSGGAASTPSPLSPGDPTAGAESPGNQTYAYPKCQL